jgi:carbon monoxide dehydrogenase subunit G
VKITFTHRFDATIDEVWSMFHDPEAHLAKFRRMGHRDLEVVAEERTDDALDLTLRRQVDLDVPAVAAKFISPSNTVTSVDHWQRDSPTRLSGHYSVDIQGAPAESSGTTQVEADGTGCTYTVELEVKVKVPIVGDKIAKALRPQLEAQMREEFAAADAWLAGE